MGRYVMPLRRFAQAVRPSQDMVHRMRGWLVLLGLSLTVWGLVALLIWWL